MSDEPRKWKDLFTNLEINGYTVGMADLKGAWIEIYQYEMTRLFAQDPVIKVIGDWPLVKQSLPLITILRLGDNGTERFIGEAYEESSRPARLEIESKAAAHEGPAPAEGMTSHDPGVETSGWMFQEELEIRAWAENHEIADALYRLNKAIAAGWAESVCKAMDIPSYSIIAGRDERAIETTSGKPLFWRPFHFMASVPLRLLKATDIVTDVRASQRATSSNS